MTAFVLVRLMTAGALLVAAASPALAQAPKPWKHGIIAPKADAGFLLMAAKRGFAEKEGLKLELLEVKDDQIGLKALLSGELDSYEGGVQGAIAVNVRGGDVKIMGCHCGRPARHHGQGGHRQDRGPQGQGRGCIRARLVS